MLEVVCLNWMSHADIRRNKEWKDRKKKEIRGRERERTMKTK